MLSSGNGLKVGIETVTRVESQRESIMFLQLFMSVLHIVLFRFL